MSFARECKEELCLNYDLSDSEKKIELEAFLRLNGSIVKRKEGLTLIFETKFAFVAKRYLSLLSDLYQVKCELYTHKQQFSDKPLFLCEASDKVLEISNDNSLLFGFPNRELIENDETLKKAFLRASFLAKGSVNDCKKTDYHLELSVKDTELPIFIQHLMNDFSLNAKISKRRNEYVVYIKEASKIVDFMRIIGISKNAFIYEEEMIKRSVSSQISKKMNCEIANEVKTLEAGKEQIKYITYLEYNYPLEHMDPKILLIMKVRKENPEATFKELIEILDKEYGEKISKSGLNHRFIKIKELARKLHDEIEGTKGA